PPSSRPGRPCRHFLPRSSRRICRPPPCRKSIVATLRSAASHLAYDRRTVTPEDQLALVLVVTPTAQGNVGDGGRPLPRIGLNVVELQEGPLRAPPPGGSDKGALAHIATPDHALDLSRDVARVQRVFPGCFIRLRTDRPTWPRPHRRPDLPPLDAFEQQSERPVEDRPGIAVGDLAPEKSLKAPKLVVGLRANGELHPVALWSRGLDDRTGRWNERRRGRGDRTGLFGGRADRRLGGRGRQERWRRRQGGKPAHQGRDVRSRRQLGQERF